MGPWVDVDDDVAQSVAELRRRADELAVLNDLARRLAALHDTREVLDEVARQARRLLGVDVAYIMLLRAERLRIEVVDGAMGVGDARHRARVGAGPRWPGPRDGSAAVRASATSRTPGSRTARAPTRRR